MASGMGPRLGPGEAELGKGQTVARTGGLAK